MKIYDVFIEQNNNVTKQSETELLLKVDMASRGYFYLYH